MQKFEKILKEESEGVSMKKILILILFIMVLVTGIFSQENVINFTYQSRDKLYPITNKLWVNINVAKWVLDIPNNAIKDGDKLHIVETEYEEVVYIKRFVVNENTYVGKINTKLTNSYAIVVDYITQDDYVKTRLWINRERKSLFDIEHYFLWFYLPGNLEDYEVTSKFGDRKRQPEYYGGPDREIHRGIDFGTKIGTPVLSALDSDMIIGYSPELGRFASLSFLRAYWEKPTNGGSRRTIRKRQVIGDYHLDGYPEEILSRFLNTPEYSNWIHSILQKPAEQILHYLIETDREDIYSNVTIKVKAGETIGYTGWTGRATNPHLHFGMKTVTSDEPIFIDPDYIHEHYMTKKIDREDYL